MEKNAFKVGETPSEGRLDERYTLLAQAPEKRLKWLLDVAHQNTAVLYIPGRGYRAIDLPVMK